MQVQGIQNDFLIDRSTLRFSRIPGKNEILDLNFKFENKAPSVNIILMQKVQEQTVLEPQTNRPIDVTLTNKSYDKHPIPQTVGMQFFAGAN